MLLEKTAEGKRAAEEVARLIQQLERSLKKNEEESGRIPEKTVGILKGFGSDKAEERKKAGEDLRKTFDGLFRKMKTEEQETQDKKSPVTVKEFSATVKKLRVVSRSVKATEQEAAGKEFTAISQRLINQLGSEEYWERQVASRALGMIGHATKSAVKDALRNPDLEIRRRAERLYRPLAREDESAAGFFTYPVAELEKLGPAASAAVPVLIKALEVEDAELKVAVARTLATIGPGAKAAVPALAETLKDHDHKVREQAAKTLMRLGKDAKTALPALRAALEDKHFYVRRSAASALGSMGKEAEAALPDLIKRLKDENGTVRDDALKAVAAIGVKKPEIVTALTKIVADEDYIGVKMLAIETLKTYGAKAKEAIPALSKAVEHKDARIRRLAAETLGTMGAEASVALAGLRKLAATKIDPANNSWDAGQERLAVKAAADAVKKIESAGKDKKKETGYLMELPDLRGICMAEAGVGQLGELAAPDPIRGQGAQRLVAARK